MIDQDTIFLLDGAGQLQKIPHRRYDSEDLLQQLIDHHPDLLVGEQIDPDDPPRWLMVQREAGIPDAEAGYDRWAIDHLLLDQNGRPTLVEVKRSTDTRIRREVVGQMLDYAANAVKFWPPERIRELAVSQYGGLEALEMNIRDLLRDPESDTEEFWEMVERKQKQGEMRLLFVADAIPKELRRIIEFLNEHMPRIEVLGVEIRKYEREGTRVLVPRVIGRTAQAEDRKAVASSRKWTIEEVVERFSDNGDPNPRRVVSQLIDWTDQRPSVFVETGSGAKYATLRFRIQTERNPVTFIVFWPDEKDGSLRASLYFGSLWGGIPAFADAAARQEVARTIHDEIDAQFDRTAFEKYPSFSVHNNRAVDAVLRLMEEIVRKATADSER